MRSTAWQFHDLDPFQLYLPGIGMFEESKAAAKEHGHDVRVEFIGETRSQALLRRVRRPDNGYRLQPPSPYGQRFPSRLSRK